MADGLPIIKETKFEAFEDQQIFMNTVLEAKHRYYNYGGSIRSGKTYACIGLIITLAKIFAGSRWVIIRKDLPTLKRTTIPTFNRICPENFIKRPLNKQDFNIVMQNNSEVLFMPEAADRDPERFRLGGLEVNGIFFNQIEECQEKTFNMGIQRIGQWPIEPMPPAMILADCNPAQNWVKTKFYDPWKSGNLGASYFFQQADIFKNPHLSQEYLDSLKDLPPEIYLRFVEGSWEAVDALNQLVSWEDIHAAYRWIVSADKERCLGVDVGHKGPDPTVLYMLEGPNIVEREELPVTKTTEVRDLILKYILKHNISADRICVDAVGVGAGVVDELEEKGYRVIAMKGGAKDIVKSAHTDSHFRFAHWKAWSYWAAAQALQNKEIGGVRHDKLISDAGAIWYFIRGDKEIWTESKEDLRKRLGRSCDDWDAFVYAIWAKHHHQFVGGGFQFSTGSQYRKNLEEQEQREAEAKAEAEAAHSRIRIAA